MCLSRLPRIFMQLGKDLHPRAGQGVIMGCALSLGACTLVLDLNRAQCERTADCAVLASSARCVGGFCKEGSETAEPNSTDAAECSEHADCEGEEFCQEGSCQAGCRDASACELGQKCEEGKCTGDAEARWACLDPTDSGLLLSGPTHVSIPVEDVFGELVQDVEVELCSGFDANCDAPTSIPLTEDGMIELELTLNADWYVTVVAPDFAPLVYMIPDWIREGDVLGPARLVPAELRQNLILATGNTLDSNRGVVSLELFDCDGVEPGGVILRSNRADDKTVPTYYPIGSDLTSTLEGEGAAGLINHLPGIAAIEVVLEDTGQVLGEVRANVWKGYTTLITLGIPPH